jgi:hypothetical protein
MINEFNLFTLPKEGPYIGISRDGKRTFENGRTIRFLIYGAYNAGGLMGSECNGILILDEDNKRVLADEICKEQSGYFGPSEHQIKSWGIFMICDWETLCDIVNNSNRARYPLNTGPTKIATPVPNYSTIKEFNFKTPKWVNDLMNKEFSSGSHMGQDGLDWCNDSRLWWKGFLQHIGGTDMDFHINHYEWSIFFKIGEQWWYTNSGDCRFKTCVNLGLLIRKADGPKDYQGHQNQWVHLDESFCHNLVTIVTGNLNRNNV